MISSLFLTLFKKRNKTLQYYQHDSMLFLDFKVLRLDVLMICSGATFIRRARAPLASTSERRMAMCSQHDPCHHSAMSTAPEPQPMADGVMTHTLWQALPLDHK